MLWLGLGLLATCGAWRRFRRWRRRHAVSPAWLITNDRREWSAGIDQSRIATWPIPRDPAADISHDPHH